MAAKNRGSVSGRVGDTPGPAACAAGVRVLIRSGGNLRLLPGPQGRTPGPHRSPALRVESVVAPGIQPGTVGRVVVCLQFICAVGFRKTYSRSAGRFRDQNGPAREPLTTAAGATFRVTARSRRRRHDFREPATAEAAYLSTMPARCWSARNSGQAPSVPIRFADATRR